MILSSLHLFVLVLLIQRCHKLQKLLVFLPQFPRPAFTCDGYVLRDNTDLKEIHILKEILAVRVGSIVIRQNIIQLKSGRTGTERVQAVVTLAIRALERCLRDRHGGSGALRRQSWWFCDASGLGKAKA